MVRHRLSDDEWDLISDLFPEPTGVGRPPNNPGDMMDGIRWILRTGAPWRDVPEEIGKWSSVWDAFDRWNRDGTLAEILSRLMSSHVDVGLLRNDVWLVDATIVRAARCAAGGGKQDDDDEPDDHGLGRSRGGFSTKIHLVADDQGHPLAAKLSPGQEHESQSLCELQEAVDVANHEGQLVPLPEKLAADKGYRADWIDEYLLELGITPVIPSKANQDREERVVEFDRDTYRSRNIIERLIGWLKECRRILTRFEKTAKNFLGNDPRRFHSSIPTTNLLLAVSGQSLVDDAPISQRPCSHPKAQPEMNDAGLHKSHTLPPPRKPRIPESSGKSVLPCVIEPTYSSDVGQRNA